MKKQYTITILTFTIVFGLPLLLNQDSSTQDRVEEGELNNVSSFKYYLDEGNSSIEDKMKKQDVVIVEPVVMDEAYIQAAQNSGTLVYGYINSMEADKWKEDLYEQFNEDDFFVENGKKVYFSEWDSYLMDMTSKHYQDVLLDEVEAEVADKGLDGVFLDTVGNIDSQFEGDPVVLKEQREAMATFMQRIEEKFPRLSISQNWGIDTLVEHTAPYVDFIMWEDFSYSTVNNDAWSEDRMESLKQVRDDYGTEVFTVSFKEKEESRKLAEQHDFKHVHNAEGSYYNTWE
ncbi:endo-alpha-1,4-polygalactosaminidase (GH114 family) [Salibacterium salarium]|uniref:endo alpha-1,4 polygalactosaminidase n=1 Tax=Salibacterium salarium TaxID=284579 RepID=UPI0027828F1C|nr:endo alpha-1,4 polygalactosaminidase [Salibacterium salarium]MDQ0298451.1 endo-alpha-1,4-polygalactosaminidase (GH114 family) [Salibacterium salarium]